MKPRTAKLIKGMVAGSELCLSKVITMVEDDSPDAPEIMEFIYPYLGRAYCVGITGAPGVGKSTLFSVISKLISG